MRNYLFIVLLALFPMFSFAKPVSGGDGVGNGGDRVSMSFVSIAWDLYNNLNASAISLPGSLRLEDFKSAIEGTKVASKTTLILRGDEVDAINYPDQHRIEVNRTRWNADGDISSRQGLVLHEFLGVMRLDDHDYFLSSTMIKLLQSWMGSHSYGDKELFCAVSHFNGDIMEGASLNRPVAFSLNSKGEWVAKLLFTDNQGRSYSVEQNQNVISARVSYNGEDIASSRSAISDSGQWEFTFKNNLKAGTIEIDCKNNAR